MKENCRKRKTYLFKNEMKLSFDINTSLCELKKKKK